MKQSLTLSLFLILIFSTMSLAQDELKTSPSGAGETQAKKDSTGMISSDLNEKQQKAKAKCDAEVEQIFEEANAKVQQIEQEMREHFDAVDNFQWGRHIHNSSYRKNSIAEECNERIDQIKARAQYQADQVIIAYKEKANALDDSPKGTNIYVRNY